MIRRLATLSLVAAIVACNSEGATAPDRPITAVTVTPPSPAMVVGQSAKLAVKVTGGFSHPVVTWSSSNPNVLTVDDTGFVVARAIGSATISATAGSITGTSTITVTTGVTGVTVTPATASLLVSQSVQLTAVVSGNNVQPQTVTWASSNANVSVDATGRVTANAAGTATVTATAAGLTGSSTITVTSGVTGVTVTPATSSLAVSQSVQLSAVVSGTYLQPPTVTWTSSNSNVASVDATGRVTAKAAGSATVTATAAGLSGSSTITVTAGVIDRVSVCDGANSAACTPGATLSALGTSATARASTYNTLGGDVTSSCVFTWVPSAAGVVSISFFGDATKRDALITRTGYGVISIVVTCGSVPGVFSIGGPAEPPPPPTAP